MATTRSRTPREDNVTDLQPTPTTDSTPDVSIFDTVRFPGRGRSTENVDMDERVADALARRKKYMDAGVDAARIVNVVDMTDDGKPLDEKQINKFRTGLSNALARVADGVWKIEWRSLPDQDSAREKYLAYERSFGTEIGNATHVFRVTPKNGTDPHAAADAGNGGEPPEAA